VTGAAASVGTRPRSVVLAVALAVVAAAAGLAGCAGSHGAEKAAVTTTVAPTTTTTEPPLAAGRQISVYTPSVGDCFDNRTIGTPPDTSEIVLLLACPIPHQNEVYAVVPYPPSPTFPGTAALEAYAKATCVSNFAAYVGKPYETSIYDLAYQVPTAASWGNGIRHVIGCLLVDRNGNRMVGTARGSAK
jgi:hypothetical protein